MDDATMRAIMLTTPRTFSTSPTIYIRHMYSSCFTAIPGGFHDGLAITPPPEKFVGTFSRNDITFEAPPHTARPRNDDRIVHDAERAGVRNIFTIFRHARTSPRQPQNKYRLALLSFSPAFSRWRGCHLSSFCSVHFLKESQMRKYAAHICAPFYHDDAR